MGLRMVGGERVALECSQALISPFTGRPGGHSYISSDIPGGVSNGEREWSGLFESAHQTRVISQDNSLPNVSLNLFKVKPSEITVSVNFTSLV